MNIHKNARLTPIRREEMAISVVEGRLSKAQACEAYGVSAKVVTKWVERYKALGHQGMMDRSSRPPIAGKMDKTRTAGLFGQALRHAVELLFIQPNTAYRRKSSCR